MVAQRDIAAGDVLMRIPLSLLLTPAVARAALPHPLPAADTVALCTFLALERRKGLHGSFWGPYIASLPAEGAFTCCVAFTPAQTALLGKAASDVRVLAEKYVAEMRAGHAAAVAALQDAAPTLEEYRWAAAIVLTRACYAFAEGGCCLVPFMDMLNHSPEAQSEARIANGCYEIVTMVPFARGDQVFINYGSHDNATLAALYGFVLPTNHFDRVRLDAALQLAMRDTPECSIALDRKQALFYQIVGMSSARDLFIYQEGEVAWNLVAFLRIFCEDSAELRRGAHRNVSKDMAISPQNERRVNSVLQRACQLVLCTLDECLAEADQLDAWTHRTLTLLIKSQRKIIEDALRRI